jgi:hypothetical protein
LEDKLQDALPLGGEGREPAGGETEEKDEKDGHKKAHDEVIGNWTLRVLRLDAEEVEQGEDGPAEDFVEEFDGEQAVL